MRTLLVGILTVLAAFVAQGQNVDEAELRRRDLSGIVFRNYVGPLTVINTAQEIRSIGIGLGAGVQGQERFTWAGRYSIVRVYTPEDPKLSADILIIEPTARVDHINGLNLIVSGYLERVFNYSRSDAALLANFITRYNAFYRGNLNFFRESFVPRVVGFLSADNAGLSTFYAEWPGRTRMVIPLRSSVSAGPRGLIDADEVSRPEVTQALPDTPEALQERRDIVDLREREIQREEEAIRQREEEIAQRPEQPTPAPPSGQPPTIQTPTPAATNENRPQPMNQPPGEGAPPAAQPPTTPDREDLSRAREELAQREEALVRDREEITRDQERIAATQPTTAPEREPVEPVLFLAVEGDGTFSRLMILDARARRTLVRSELNSIRGRRFENLPDGYLVIAGREGGDAAVRLVVLDKERLAVLRQGADDIHSSSDLVVQGQTIYAIVRDGTQFRLATFNPALALQRRSASAIAPQTAIQVEAGRILVQDPDGRVLFLNPSTLERTVEITP